MKDYNMECGRFRYIVPFEFNIEAVDFNEVCNRISEHSDWELMNENKSDPDIYEYIVDAFKKKDNNSNIGCEWQYTNKDGENRILQIAYKTEEDICKILNVSDMGLYVFRTGVGLIWYEISGLEGKFTTKELVDFQNKFKELNWDSNLDVFMPLLGKTAYTCIENEGLLVELKDIKADELDRYVKCVGENGEPKYILQENLVPTIKEGKKKKKKRKEPLDIRKEEKSNLVNCTWKKTTDGTIDFNAKVRFTNSMGNWIVGILNELATDEFSFKVKFYPGRKNCMNDKGVAPFAPDKALLFNYLNVSETEIDDDRDFVELAYCLTNGYDETYMMTDDMKNNMYIPFKDAYWYLNKQGCGYYVKTNEGNKGFFNNNLRSEVITDYFTLYILLLHQHFTLLRYTNVLEKELSADAREYRDDLKHMGLLEKIQSDINVFLVKSVYSSVSHIQHQNCFYEYGEKALGIREDIESITVGLDSLEELQRAVNQKEADKASSRLSIGLGFVSLLTIFSAFSDGFEGLNKIMLQDWSGYSHKFIAACVVLGIVIVVIGIVSVKVLYDAIRQYFKNKK